MAARNPYSKLALASDRRALARVPGNHMIRPGSTERLVGNNGEINASSLRDLNHNLALILNMANAGVIGPPEKTPVVQATAAERRQELSAAYHDNGGKWVEMGATIAGEVSEVATRDGFLRRIFLKFDAPTQGRILIRVRNNQVIAMIATSPTHMWPRFIRENDRYIEPPEFYVKANIRVDEIELRQSPGDILEEKFIETTQSIMVQEDRLLKRLMDSAVGQFGQLQYLAGGVTPSNLGLLKDQVDRWGLPAQTLLLTTSGMTDLTTSASFGTWFDPVTQFEVVSTGRVGNILGMQVLTDAWREPTLRVLNPTDVYVLAAPELLGVYTDRGPVDARAVDNYPDGMPARGWTFFEILSVTLFNAKAISKGIRS
jgi:hypothetical protein